MDERWPQVARLDTAALIARIHAGGGPEVKPVARLRGGSVGASLVRLVDGTPAVLSAWPPGADDAHRVVDLVERLRRRGYPAPRYLHVIDCGDAVAVIQDWVDGTLPECFDEDLVRRLLRLHDRQRNVAVELAGSIADLYLERDGPGFCLHEPMRQHSARTAALLERILMIARASAYDVGAGHDVVHGDFHPGNVLVDGSGGIVGVVDWTGARIGDAGVDLFNLGLVLDWLGAPVSSLQIVREHIRTRVRADAVPAFAAHLVLRQVDWVIRHYTDQLDRWSDIADDWLDWAQDQ